MSAFGGGYIPTEDLVFYVDAGNPESYPGTGVTWYDLSGNGLNVTKTGGAAWNQGGYFTTSGHNQLYILGSNPKSNLLEFDYDDPKTLICIAYIPSNINGAWMSKMGVNDAGSLYYRGWDLYMNSNVNVSQHNISQWAVKAHRRHGVFSGISTLNDDIHMACVTYDGSALVTGITSYIDAIPADSYVDTIYGTLDTTMVESITPFVIGGRSFANALFGNYYLCLIYARELKQKEIEQIYRSFRSRLS